MLEYLKGWLELKVDRKAVTALEYGLVAALVAVAIVGALRLLGNNLRLTFNSVSSNLT